MGEDTAPDTKPKEAEARPETERGGMPDWIRFPLVLAIVGGVAALFLALMYGLTKERIEASEGRKVEGAFKSILGEKYAGAKEKQSDGGTYVILTDASGAKVALAMQVACKGSYNPGSPIKLMVVLDPGLSTVLGVRVVTSKETPGFGERMNDTLAPNSLLGLSVGRPNKSRVVLKSRGTEVGAIEKKPDGSIVVVAAGEEVTEIPARDVAAVTAAPFPPAFVDQFTGLPLIEARLAEDGGGIDALSGATITSRAVVNGVKAAGAALKDAARSR